MDRLNVDLLVNKISVLVPIQRVGLWMQAQCECELCVMHDAEHYQWNSPLDATLQRFYFPQSERSASLQLLEGTCLVPNYLFYEHPVQTLLSVSYTSCKQLCPHKQDPDSSGAGKVSVAVSVSCLSCRVRFLLFSTELLAVQQLPKPPLESQKDMQVKLDLR